MKPNGLDFSIPLNDKWSVYEYYISDCLKYNMRAASFTYFCRIWNVAFPHTRLRSKVSTPGKCFVCSLAENIRLSTTSTEAEKIAAVELHHMHCGGFIMQERMAYLRVVQKARENPDKVFSCVMDGMDQNHSELPHEPQQANSDAQKMHVTGVLEHGYGVVYYTNFQNIKKSANWSAHCFLTQLNK